MLSGVVPRDLSVDRQNSTAQVASRRKWDSSCRGATCVVPHNVPHIFPPVSWSVRFDVKVAKRHANIINAMLRPQQPM